MPRVDLTSLCSIFVLALGGVFVVAGLFFGDGTEVAFGLVLIVWAALSR